MGDKIRTMAALARNGLRAARRGFHSSGPCQGSISAGSKCPQRQGPAEMAELPANFHALTGGANHAAITGSSLEKSNGYNNPAMHEQAELWWDDGRAMVEPVFDADHIPLQEARRMLGAGFAFFGLVLGIQYWRDPSGTRPTVPRDMPDSEIWERNQYVAPASAAAAAAVEEEEDE